MKSFLVIFFVVSCVLSSAVINAQDGFNRYRNSTVGDTNDRDGYDYRNSIDRNDYRNPTDGEMDDRNGSYTGDRHRCHDEKPSRDGTGGGGFLSGLLGSLSKLF